MSADKSNRYRISSKFVLLKIGIGIGLLSILISTYQAFQANFVPSDVVISIVLTIVILFGILYFISTGKRVDYDDVKQVLYIVDEKRDCEIQVPVERIQMIQVSSLSGQGRGAYKIVYLDDSQFTQRIWVFTIPFDRSIDTIITDAELKNPNFEKRIWSIGWNEFI